MFQKTLAISDYYFGADDWEYPAGPDPDVRDVARRADPRRGAAAGLDAMVPGVAFEAMADHSIDFWLQSEDLPRPENRIYYDGDRVVLDIHEGNMEAQPRLRAKLEGLLMPLGGFPHLIDRNLYLGKDIPIGGTAHQAGTMRFGTDPATSVLDLDCKAHELDNLYVADASFFPSIGAVNPTLTIIANALRVADGIKATAGRVVGRLAFAAVLAALFAATSRRRGRVLRFTRVVADLERSEAFYCDSLGMEVAGRRAGDPMLAARLGVPGAKMHEVVLRCGREEVALVRFDPPGSPARASRRSDDLAFQHLAVVVGDMRAAYDILRQQVVELH